MHPFRFARVPAALFICVTASPLAAQSALTLAGALAEARAHNATLPVVGFDTASAAARILIARGRFGPSIGIDGDIHGGSPSQYASGDARLQMVGSVPIYDGGRLRAGVQVAEAERSLSAARFRIARRDVDFGVRFWFSQASELQDDIALGERGLDRLRRYVEFIDARRRSGQAVVGDLLRARVQLDRQAADLADSRRQWAGAALQLKELLGRDLNDTIVLAPLPAPAPPTEPAQNAWAGTPDVAAAEAARRSSLAAIAAVKADRRPNLDLGANVGAQPVIGSSFNAPLNTGRGVGGEITLGLRWPLWDRGVYRNRLAEAQIALQQAAQQATVTLRAARLQWYQARTDLTNLFQVVQLRDSTVPTAQDAYLRAESLYRGGAANTLQVLDAYTQWIQAGLDAARARFDYRVAQARLARWGAE